MTRSGMRARLRPGPWPGSGTATACECPHRYGFYLRIRRLEQTSQRIDRFFTDCCESPDVIDLELRILLCLQRCIERTDSCRILDLVERPGGKLPNARRRITKESENRWRSFLRTDMSDRPDCASTNTLVVVRHRRRERSHRVAGSDVSE